MPATRQHWEAQLVTPSSSERLQALFSCPYSDSDCPAIVLTDSPLSFHENTLECPGNHTGVLCASCVRGCSRRGSSDNSCQPCSDVAGYVAATFGMGLGWFVSIVVVAVVLVCVGVYLIWEQLRWFKVQAKPNLRILLGSAQVLALLPAVLELVFPAQPKAALSFLALAVADVREVLRVECWGWSFFDKTAAAVLGIPSIAAILVGLRWLWRIWVARREGNSGTGDERTQERRAEASAEATSGMWFMVMLLYPQLSATIFSVLRCRALGENSSWLEADYAVSCQSERYQTFRVMAIVLVVLVPLGVPLLLLRLLLRHQQHTGDEWDQQRLSAPSLQASTQLKQMYRRTQAKQAFGFLTEDFKPEWYWFEPVDMLRKLALSGLLQLVHRGTAAQCFCGCAISFVSFGVQQRFQPYHFPESNALKALVDCQLFLTFLISFILRVLPEIDSAEPFQQGFYGWLLVCSMGLLLCAAIGLTARQIHRERKRQKTGLLLPPLLGNSSGSGADSVSGEGREAPTSVSSLLDAAQLGGSE
jgi:hypothetical protein